MNMNQISVSRDGDEIFISQDDGHQCGQCGDQNEDVVIITLWQAQSVANAIIRILEGADSPEEVK